MRGFDVFFIWGSPCFFLDLGLARFNCVSPEKQEKEVQSRPYDVAKRCENDWSTEPLNGNPQLGTCHNCTKNTSRQGKPYWLESHSMHDPLIMSYQVFWAQKGPKINTYHTSITNTRASIDSIGAIQRGDSPHSLEVGLTTPVPLPLCCPACRDLHGRTGVDNQVCWSCFF